MGNDYDSQLEHFSEYHMENESSKPPIGPALPALGHAVSGSIGAVLSHLLIYPLDLVITRLQTQGQFSSKRSKDEKPSDDAQYHDVLDALQKIYKQEGGWRAFYTGVGNCTAKAAADSFLFFLAYNFLREARRPVATTNSKRRGGPVPLPFAEELLIGVVAGAFARFWTTPVQNIVTRQQTAAMIHARDPASSLGPGLSARDIALQIKDEKGVRGFWSGYSATLILTVNPSITFLLHELFLRLLVPTSRRKNPGPRITFLLAAASKAVASTITYPFSLAKARAQLSSQTPAPSPSELEKDSKSDAVKEAEAVAARTTVFSIIMHIARSEGLLALYQGLGGEVLKGFFSHGLTMLMKERIHSAVIQLYYLILKALRRYPSPEELAKAAGDKVGSAASGAKRAFTRDTVPTGDVYGKSWKREDKTVFEPLTKPIASGVESAKSIATTAVEKAKDAMRNDTVPPGDVYGKSAKSTSAAHPDPETRQLGRSVDVQQQVAEKATSTMSDNNNTVPPGDVYGKAETSVPQPDPEASHLKNSAAAGQELAAKALDKAKDAVKGGKETVTPGDVYGNETKKE